MLCSINATFEKLDVIFWFEKHGEDRHYLCMHSRQEEFELIELNFRAREFLLLDVHDDQRNFVATVAQSFADALFPQDEGLGKPKAWIRGILSRGKPAAFIMCADPTESQIDPWIWRLLVDKTYQGLGIGRFAIQSVLSRYQEMGCRRVLVSWAPKKGNPGDFYKKLGFQETGELNDGEIVAEFRFEVEESPYKPEALTFLGATTATKTAPASATHPAIVSED